VIEALGEAMALVGKAGIDPPLRAGRGDDDQGAPPRG
jgi:hypothetical protein